MAPDLHHDAAVAPELGNLAGRPGGEPDPIPDRQLTGLGHLLHRVVVEYVAFGPDALFHQPARLPGRRLVGRPLGQGQGVLHPTAGLEQVGPGLLGPLPLGFLLRAAEFGLTGPL